MAVPARWPLGGGARGGSRAGPAEDPLLAPPGGKPGWLTNACAMRLIFGDVNSCMLRGFMFVTHFDCDDAYTMCLILPIPEVFRGAWGGWKYHLFSLCHLLFKHLPLLIHPIFMFQVLLPSLFHSFSPSHSLFPSQLSPPSLLHCLFRSLLQG